MKFVCDRENLLKGLRKIQSAVATKSTLPILSNFLLEAKDNTLNLVATDLEVGVQCQVTCKGDRPGGIAVPAKKFNDIIRELPEGTELTINVDENNRLTGSCRKIKFSLLCLPKDDFPSLPKFKEEQAFSIPGNQLNDMVRKTAFAMSTDETRFSMNGLYFNVVGKEIRIIATDGRRMALSTYETEKENPNPAGVIISSKAVPHILNLLSEMPAEEMVKVSISTNQIALKTTDTVFITRLVEGSFPNYERVIPKAQDIILTVNTVELLSTVKRVSLFTAERVGVLKYGLDKNSLCISAVNPGIGEAEEILEIEYTGQPLEISFSANYLLDVLKVILSDKVSLEFNSALGPAVFRSAGKNEKYLCVIMPLRTQ